MRNAVTDYDIYKTKVHDTFFSTWYLGDYINSKEYRKPDWLIKMEALKEKLAGKTFVKNIFFNILK